MKLRIRFLALLMVFCLCMSLAACGSDGTSDSAPVTLRVASQDTADSLSGKLLSEFKANVEDKSNGTITVELHFSGSLGSLNDMIEGVSMGTIDMATAGIGSFQGYCDNMMIFDNFMVGNSDEFLTLWNSEVGRQVLDQLKSESGISIIAYNLCGVGRLEFWTNRDYDSIDSLKNANLRTNSTKTMNLACEAIGAVGYGVSNSEQYNAFQTGMIDAMGLDAGNMIDQGFLQKGMYRLNIMDNYMASILAISQSTWEKLSSEQQKVITDCAKLYSDASAAQYADKQVETAEALKEYDIIPCSISEADIAKLNEMIATALHEYYGEVCDAEVLSQAIAALGK